MPMTYNTLVAPKGAAGSILNWVGYTKVDIVTALDEAQALIYSLLRVREMRTQWVFGVPVGGCKAALPTGFLDPIGRLRDNFSNRYGHKTESEVTDGRMYDVSPGGTFGAGPFTSGAIGSSTITAFLPAHGLSQDSDITISTSGVVDGIVVNGTRLVTNVVSADVFNFEGDGTAVLGNESGGGEDATYTANVLIQGTPQRWAVWDECLQFDGAFVTATQFRLMCFKSKPLLSTSNQSNFLTDRYPHLVRTACMASAASIMKDDNEYNKHLKALEGLIQSIQVEADLLYRGADLDTETP